MWTWGWFLFAQQILRLFGYSIWCGTGVACLLASSCCQLSAKLLVTTLVGSFVVLAPRFWGLIIVGGLLPPGSPLPSSQWSLVRPISPVLRLPRLLTQQSAIFFNFCCFVCRVSRAGSGAAGWPAPLIVSNLCIPGQACGLSSYQIANLPSASEHNIPQTVLRTAEPASI